MLGFVLTCQKMTCGSDEEHRHFPVVTTLYDLYSGLWGWDGEQLCIGLHLQILISDFDLYSILSILSIHIKTVREHNHFIAFFFSHTHCNPMSLVNGLTNSCADVKVTCSLSQHLLNSDKNYGSQDKLSANKQTAAPPSLHWTFKGKIHLQLSGERVKLLLQDAGKLSVNEGYKQS